MTPTGPRPLRATYRLQLGPDLGFADAQALLPYLDDLGVSHLYLSPVWEARAGSTHGYDVIDPAAVSVALGGEDGLRALAADAHRRGMGLVLDVVPNHMATDDANRYWSDPALRAKFFDLDRVTGRHRRFFDVDELAGVRQEDPEVFAATHAKVIELVRDGVADGIRVDHPDGMADPAGYLRRLHDAGVDRVWVEKILSAETGEQLRVGWPTAGTTGYEFCVDVQAIFVDPAGEAPLTALWTELSGDARPFSDWADEAKAEQAATTFGREVDRLGAVHDVPGTTEALSALEIYRTYVVPERDEVAPEDREALAHVPEAVRRAALLEDPKVPAEWVVRFQQTTSPVMAKGVEDTAFYRYHRLLALNEVGGDPGRFGLSVDAFHARAAERGRRFPENLLATSTHDTKRSGDVRARLGALAGLGEEWAGAVRRWHADNAELRDVAAPTPAEELLVYQTLIGAWPIELERLEPYLIKALREAKQGTSWVDPDEAHEHGVLEFARRLYEHGPFRYGFDGWAARVADVGARAALGQVLLKLTVPGVPDLYQGDETWFSALVDPDNRRPVDFAARAEALAALRGGDAPSRERAKLHLVWKALELRRELPGTFAQGAYTPIPAGDGVCAFLRGEDVLVAVALRDAGAGTEGWALPAAAAGTWRSVLDGAEFDLPDQASLAGVLGPDGRALLRRI
ncbi:malto-oligosyltrehalose synthase [Paraconexibacter antarcticus]|uniref:Malto-oligosyltrehalose synthase n=1 Tax=Paraconexibacter antarcticus TaxID=2949664 RepID=A0ABY5DM29_9ACTN|nr:malto-oligosyltrehalose synthase [Paraconexibacter antarcticus]UTI62975.1 malto-oligosyltrehalose synthase [Paraconexibacter antarcticus]